MRIVSLLPSATEIVCALGLSRQLVGVTHECDFPAEAARKAVMTRPTLDLDGASNATIDRRRPGRRGQRQRRCTRSTRQPSVGPGRTSSSPRSSARVCAPSYASVQELAHAISPDIAVLSLEPTSIEGIFNSITTVGAMTETERRAHRPPRSPPRTPRPDRAEGREGANGRPPPAPGGGARVARSADGRRPLGARADPPGRRLGPPRHGRRGVDPDDLERRSATSSRTCSS